jgi:hypothetical protein
MARGPLAGASGPGKFSARTDGLELGSTSYGEGVETQAIKSGAPLAKSQKMPSATNTEVRQAAAKAPVTPLFAPTERPQDSMHGAANQPMPKLTLPEGEDDTNFRATIAAYMPVLTYISGLPNTSPETRKAIRQLRDAL